jgi:hypothetical protein
VPLPANLALKDAAAHVFNAIDTNKDGFLDRNEVKQAFIQIGHMDERFKFIKQADQYAGSLVDAGDLDGDGKINKKEFMKMVKAGALHAKKEAKEKETPRSTALEKSSRFASSFFLAPRDKNIETLTIGTDQWLLHPKTPLHLAWSGFMSFLIFVVMILMPLSFGWQQFGDSLLVYTTLIDYAFMIDILKTFFTGMVDDDDNVVMDAKQIRSKYLKGYFTFDLLSSLPLDLIFYLVSAWNIKICTRHCQTCANDCLSITFVCRPSSCKGRQRTRSSCQSCCSLRSCCAFVASDEY